MKLTSMGKHIGPGFLLAGAAIGVSHLVQATRAGADYGFALVWALVLACLTKYPFLEFGPRYTAATGKDLISGYRKLGKFSYYSYIIITLGTMFVIQASVTLVTAGLAEHLFQLGWSPFTWSAVLLIFCIGLLWMGKYSGLDKSMKIIISLLTLITLIAVLLAFNTDSLARVTAKPVPSYWNLGGLAFLIAFMGWMPIPLDASVWHSLWTQEKAKEKGQSLSLKNAFLDFNIGYLAAALIGLFFLILGALVMFGSGKSFSDKSLVFATQLISLYKSILGNWSGIFIGLAAFITMLSTTLTVTDAYPRVLSKICLQQHSAKGKPQPILAKNSYRLILCVAPLLSLAILFFTDKNFTYLVDFASGLSFLSAPFLAWFNYRLVTRNDFPEAAKPSLAYRWFSISCFMGLLVLSGAYIAYQFFA